MRVAERRSRSLRGMILPGLMKAGIVLSSTGYSSLPLAPGVTGLRLSNSYHGALPTKSEDIRETTFEAY